MTHPIDDDRALFGEEFLGSPLAKAIAEVKRLRAETKGEVWTVVPSRAQKVIMQAVASGDLIPRTDAELAVALAYQRAAEMADQWMKTSLDVNPSIFCELHDAILALAPADALEELQALKRERDEWKRLYWLARSFIVHDDSCTINRYPHYRDCSCGLRAALTTPEKDAP